MILYLKCKNNFVIFESFIFLGTWQILAFLLAKIISKIDSATVLKYVSFALVFYICYIALEGLWNGFLNMKWTSLYPTILKLNVLAVTLISLIYCPVFVYCFCSIMAKIWQEGAWGTVWYLCSTTENATHSRSKMKL